VAKRSAHFDALERSILVIAGRRQHLSSHPASGMKSEAD